MDVLNHPHRSFFDLIVFSLTVFSVGHASDLRGQPGARGTAVLWREPADIASRNLFYGAGGEADRPQGPFYFIKESSSGSNPKFTVRDKNGVKWNVKLGSEARPETVASRFAWAVGYFTNEEYFLPRLQAQDMHIPLDRGQQLVARDGSVENVRLKREIKGYDWVGIWQWEDNLFSGSRELNGLKVLMAVINNWDLKDENNAVYQSAHEQIYLVSDLGATFGSAGRSFPEIKAKGNLESYRHSPFLRDMTSSTVDFCVPDRPSFVYAVGPREYLERIRMERIGRDIPREDAKWMGELLARLSPDQIRDAFRAAGYEPEEVEAFSLVVERRIALLSDL